MKSFNIKKLFLAAFFMVPLSDSNQWHIFKFMSVQPNRVSHSPSGLSISVDDSASPLIYAFKKPRVVKSMSLTARFDGKLPRLKKNIRQGMGDNDDFILRVGLIYQGEDRLNWLQRQLAPAWLVKMEKLLPENVGIKEVRFCTTCLQENLLGKVRKHMMHSKLIEECIQVVNKPGPIVMNKVFNESTPVVGLWIASDGDNLNSQFSVLIEEIKLSYK